MIKNAHIFSAAKKRQRIKINSVRLRTGKIKKGNACDKKWKRETKDAFPKMGVSHIQTVVILSLRENCGGTTF